MRWNEPGALRESKIVRMAVWIVIVAILLLHGSGAAPEAESSTNVQPTSTAPVTEHTDTSTAAKTSTAASTTATSPTGPTPSVPNGDVCVVDDDCHEAMLFCNEGRCDCRDLNTVLSSENLCIPAKKLGEACQITSQCHAGEGTYSICSNGICTCDHGLSMMPDQNGTSCVSVKDARPRPPKPHIDPNMIIIMVVLAVMFVGMCLALHLFSRSRFRNNRTIFNSPHPRLMHIKLGKKAKGHRRPSHNSLHVPISRQPSVCSQRSTASPTGSRRGSRVNSVETLKAPPPNALNGQLVAPIAQLEETSPTAEEVKKDPWKTSGPDVVKEASVVQNGPNSPTIIVTHTNGSRSPSSAEAPSPVARV